jgi:hypothetical protein
LLAGIAKEIPLSLNWGTYDNCKVGWFQEKVRFHVQSTTVIDDAGV